jgi:YkoY family integral membrane protein
MITEIAQSVGLMFSEIASKPLASMLVIGVICLIEVILSVDNAALLAIMVKDLEPENQKKALRYGILGAYLFRGLALVFAGALIQYWWIKPIGGLYLLWITFNYFKGLSTENPDDEIADKQNNWLYKATVGAIGTFWSTVILVEFCDMSLSIDNIFAVVAFTKNMVLIIFGVFIGILAMRFVAQAFVKLMEKYKFLETCAFVVIGLLGIKLMSSIVVHFYPEAKWIESENVDYIMSAITLLTFIVPIIWHNIFNKKQVDAQQNEYKTFNANETN